MPSNDVVHEAEDRGSSDVTLTSVATMNEFSNLLDSLVGRRVPFIFAIE